MRGEETTRAVEALLRVFSFCKQQPGRAAHRNPLLMKAASLLLFPLCLFFNDFESEPSVSVQHFHDWEMRKKISWAFINLGFDYPLLLGRLGDLVQPWETFDTLHEVENSLVDVPQCSAHFLFLFYLN